MEKMAEVLERRGLGVLKSGADGETRHKVATEVQYLLSRCSSSCHTSSYTSRHVVLGSDTSHWLPRWALLRTDRSRHRGCAVRGEDMGKPVETGPGNQQWQSARNTWRQGAGNQRRLSTGNSSGGGWCPESEAAGRTSDAEVLVARTTREKGGGESKDG